MRSLLDKLLSHPRLPLLCAALTLLLFLPSLWGGPVADDHMHEALLQGTPWASEHVGDAGDLFRFTDGDPLRNQQLMDLGFMPWWTWTGSRFHFLRPLAVLSHQLDELLWAGSFPLKHAHSLLWMAGLSALVALLFRRLEGPGWAGGLAAVLWAVDDAHAMAGGWVAGRNGVMAAVFAVAALLLHHRAWIARDRPRRPWLMAGLAALCFAASLAAKEGGVGALGYLFAFALVSESGQGWGGRAARLLPYLGVVAIWRVLYSTGGYGVSGAEQYLDPASGPLRFLLALLERLPVQLAAQWFVPASAFYLFLPAAVKGAFWLFCLLGLALLTWALRPLLQRDPQARFWALGMLLSAVPACAAFPQERLLLFVGLGGMGLFARYLRWVWSWRREDGAQETEAGRDQAQETAAERDQAQETAAARDGASEPLPERAPGRLRRVIVGLLLLHHGVLSPLLLPVALIGFARFGAEMQRTFDSVALPEGVEDKTLVVLGTPTIYHSSFLFLSRSQQGLPNPRRIRTLASNSSRPVPTQVERTDHHTLEVEPEGGFPWFLVRSAQQPLPPGSEVHLAGMSARVQTLSPEGWPLRVAFRFERSLDDPTLLWRVYGEGGYLPFQPPAVGESRVVGGPSS